MKKIVFLLLLFFTANAFALTAQEISDRSAALGNFFNIRTKIKTFNIEYGCVRTKTGKAENYVENSTYIVNADGGKLRVDYYFYKDNGEIFGQSKITDGNIMIMSTKVEKLDEKIVFSNYIKTTTDINLSAYSMAAGMSPEALADDYSIASFAPENSKNKEFYVIDLRGKEQFIDMVLRQYIDRKTLQLKEVALVSQEQKNEQSSKWKIKFSDYRQIDGTAYFYPYKISMEFVGFGVTTETRNLKFFKTADSKTMMDLFNPPAKDMNMPDMKNLKQNKDKAK